MSHDYFNYCRLLLRNRSGVARAFSRLNTAKPMVDRVSAGFVRQPTGAQAIVELGTMKPLANPT
jgi:hypothetical protein